MPANYVLLEKLVIGAAGATSVAFQSIPQTGYTDLIIKVSARASNTGAQRNAIDFSLTFNSNSTGYTSKILSGNAAVDSPPVSSSNSGSSIVWGGEGTNGDATANTFGNFDIYIPNYTSSNYKSVAVDSVTENNSANSETRFAAGIWANTAAITQVTLSTGTLVQYSTFYLYGIAKLNTTPAVSPKATGGDTIMTDGTYWYHAFKASGTFTPTVALSCDVITVAGGGGGGGGGGGAGGLLYSTAQSFATAQTVTIGAGGAASTKGVNSSIGSLTATAGGASDGGANANGGSGGGNSANAAGGTGVSGQGNNGGAGITFVTNCGFGGGGGAGAAGAAGTTTTGGVGGAGVNTYSAWLSATGTGVSGYIAGGGGGGCGTGTTGNGPNAGAGGAGGGAQAGVYVAGLAGTANTGGGGGGSYGTSGGAGGSGLVIVRYAV